MYLTKPRLPIWAAFAIFLSWTNLSWTISSGFPASFFWSLNLSEIIWWSEIRYEFIVIAFLPPDFYLENWAWTWRTLNQQIETKATRCLSQPPCLFIHFFICHNFNFQASFCIFFAIIICQSFSKFDFTQFLKPLLRMNFSILLIQLNLRFSLNNP